MERRRATLCDRIESWRSIQALYMPGIAQLCQTNPTRTDAMPTDQDAEKPEAIKLWLPSALPPGLRETGCISGLVDKERRLRVAEADDALVALRRQLRVTTGVFNYKKTHVSGTGQKANTRARTLLSQLTTKTRLIADRYRAARKALTILDPDSDWQRRLRPLRSEDIRGPTRTDDDESEGRQELLWIWVTTSKVPTEGDELEVAEGMYRHVLPTTHAHVFSRHVRRVGQNTSEGTSLAGGGSACARRDAPCNCFSRLEGVMVAIAKPTPLGRTR